MWRSLGLLGGCLVASVSGASQPFSVVVGGEGSDRGVGLRSLTGGGYAVTGATSSLGAEGGDGMVARFDETGSLVWHTTVGGEGDDASWQVEETAAGLTEVGFGVRPGTGLDCRLSRLSPQGDLQWSRHYGGGGAERCWDLVAVGSDGYALVGEVVSEDETVHDCLLIRTDARGEERWTRTYDKGLQERCFAVAAREDGGFLVVGQTTEDGGDERDVYLVGTDSDGGVAFEHVLGAEGIDLGHGVVSIPRGEVVIGYTAGFGSEDEDPLLVKVTPEGEVAWTRRVPLPGPSRSLSGALTPDGELCLGGFRRKEGGTVAFVAKTDLEAGLAWSVELEPFLLGYTVASAGDGGCVLTGHTEGDEGDLDLFLARVASDGSRAPEADRYELSSGTGKDGPARADEPRDATPTTEATEPAESAPSTEASAAPETPEHRWRWTDFEIVGHVDRDRAEIVELLPVELGTPYDGEPELFESCGERIESTLDVAEASCSAVRFFDGTAFLLVEIVENGEESRAQFREPPTGDVEVDAEVFELQARLMEVLQRNFRQGVEFREHTDEGYLDYSDPEMHAIVESLRELTPPHRQTLVRVIAEDADAVKRARAAWLLNWAGDEATSISEVHRYLDDPNGVVRNDVSRFMLHYLDRVESEAVLRGIVDSLARQLQRPGHGDRNKAVYALGELVEAHPEMGPYVAEKAGPWLRRLAEQSVLINVGDPARELLDQLEAGDESDQASASASSSTSR